jgi:hypothetical protein
MSRTGRIDSTLSPNLSEAVAAFQSGTASLDEVAGTYYLDPRVKRITAHACFKSKLPADFADELSQELAVLLTRKFVQAIQHPEKIYNVLHVSACHIARRKADKAGEDSLDALLERTSELDPSTSPIMVDHRQEFDEVDEKIDRNRAIYEFNRRLGEPQKGRPMQLATSLRLSIIDVTPQVVRRVKRVKAPRQEPTNVPSEAAIELNGIRRDLGYTVPEFAELLNVSKGTLSSYLYGIVRDVPEAVMREAQLLHAQSGTEFHDLIVKFGHLSMRDIVDQWVEALGVEADDKSRDTLLAETLRVDRATVWRWRERDMRPDLRKIKEYDDLVAAAVKKRQRRSARSGQATQVVSKA